MYPDHVLHATRAGVNDALGAILKGAFIAICVIAFFMHPTPWLLWGLVFLPFYLASSQNATLSAIGWFVLKVAGYGVVIWLAARLCSP